MAESDFTRESDGVSAHRAAQQILGVALYHSGMLKALGEGRIPIDLVDEHDTLAIESAALHDALLSLHEILNGDKFELGLSRHG